MFELLFQFPPSTPRNQHTIGPMAFRRPFGFQERDFSLQKFRLSQSDYGEQPRQAGIQAAHYVQGKSCIVRLRPIIRTILQVLQAETKLLSKLLDCHGISEVAPNSSDFNLLWTGSHPKPGTTLQSSSVRVIKKQTIVSQELWGRWRPINESTTSRDPTSWREKIACTRTSNGCSTRRA